MQPLKILLACIPADGHFNPLTGIASYLKAQGHDVRWYTQDYYADKLARMGIHHYPFKRAVQYNQENMDLVFAERLRYTNQIKRLNFDLEHSFLRRAPEFFADISEINASFSFDVLIADVMFTAIPLVSQILKKPVISIGVMPLVETSKDLGPAGLGMTPSTTRLGRLKQDYFRWLTDNVLFSKSHKLFRDILAGYGLMVKGNTMDYLIRSSTFMLQSGTPGFEYNRSDLGKNIRFIGPLLPLAKGRQPQSDLRERSKRYSRTILVTQGTIEKDPEKLIVPVIEAYKGTRTLVIVTTGGSKTRELRDRFPYTNVVIEDYIPFEHVLPFTNVFITNGGYGGVMLGIKHGAPMVVGGVHEGKLEITARVGYFKLGIDLKTETPDSIQIKAAVEMIAKDPTYKLNVMKLAAEFSKYDTLRLVAGYVYDATDFVSEKVDSVKILS
ncbi:glycosyltransferase [Chryseolinea sp. T2]|uniref:glycosyltransferase n=1 Tax=Chryseolinea sp. T2 TaxID=3129255 RepID=UPI003078393A